MPKEGRRKALETVMFQSDVWSRSVSHNKINPNAHILYYNGAKKKISIVKDRGLVPVAPDDRPGRVPGADHNVFVLLQADKPPAASAHRKRGYNAS